GAFKSVAKAFSLFKLHTHTHLYTSETLESDFLGRIFQIENVYTLGNFKKLNTFGKANVATKNFPIKVDELRKKFKIKDGGSDFLYFITCYAYNHILIHCSKISLNTLSLQSSILFIVYLSR